MNLRLNERNAAPHAETATVFRKLDDVVDDVTRNDVVEADGGGTTVDSRREVGKLRRPTSTTAMTSRRAARTAHAPDTTRTHHVTSSEQQRQPASVDDGERRDYLTINDFSSTVEFDDIAEYLDTPRTGSHPVQLRKCRNVECTRTARAPLLFYCIAHFMELFRSGRLRVPRDPRVGKPEVLSEPEVVSSRQNPRVTTGSEDVAVKTGSEAVALKIGSEGVALKTGSDGVRVNTGSEGVVLITRSAPKKALAENRHNSELTRQRSGVARNTTRRKNRDVITSSTPQTDRDVTTSSRDHDAVAERTARTVADHDVRHTERRRTQHRKHVMCVGARLSMCDNYGLREYNGFCRQCYECLCEERLPQLAAPEPIERTSRHTSRHASRHGARHAARTEQCACCFRAAKHCDPALYEQVFDAPSPSNADHACALRRSRCHGCNCIISGGVYCCVCATSAVHPTKSQHVIDCDARRHVLNASPTAGHRKVTPRRQYRCPSPLSDLDHDGAVTSAGASNDSDDVKLSRCYSSLSPSDSDVDSGHYVMSLGDRDFTRNCLL